MNKKITVASLFAGVGGICLKNVNLGLIIASNDVNKMQQKIEILELSVRPTNFV